jgi:hypothetical protein
MFSFKNLTFASLGLMFVGSQAMANDFAKNLTKTEQGVKTATDAKNEASNIGKETKSLFHMDKETVKKTDPSNGTETSTIKESATSTKSTTTTTSTDK